MDDPEEDEVEAFFGGKEGGSQIEDSDDEGAGLLSKSAEFKS